MQRITASFQNEENINKVLKALKEAEVAIESIGKLMSAKAEVIDEDDQYMVVVDVGKNRAEVVHTIFKSTGGKSIQNVDLNWQPGIDWVTRLGIDPPV